MREKNVFEVEVFKDTREQSHGKYKNYTRQLTKRGTTVYDFLIDNVDFVPNERMKIAVKPMGTVEAGRQLVKKTGETTAVLNFADALVPGGLVLSGATTQEENLCRCSNLYESLLTEVAHQRYYNENIKGFGINGRKVGDSIYLDNLIYSRDVLFFKDDVTYNKVKPYVMDVITCPSPSCIIKPRELEYRIIKQRTEQIIKSAILSGVHNLVLGAWGCGAFMQDPVVVSECFKATLKEYPAFSRVVFAIRNCSADSMLNNNYKTFCDTFGVRY